MADSAREAALKALHDVLQGLSGPTVRRNDPLPAKVPSGGLVILRDGDPGEPDVVLSPLTYHWRHAAEVEVLVQEAAPAARDAALDAILQGIAVAIAADPSLGGKVDYAAPGAPEIVDEAVEGATTIKAALVHVVLEYASANPLQ